jgi:hypothetical protein
MVDHNDIVEQVKIVNRIDDVIDKDGFSLGKKTGQYRRAQQHDSLVVNVETQSYYWNSRNEKGDVINWVMRRNNCDFKTAIELLCRRAGIPEPNWGKQSVEERIAARNREDAFEVAVSVFSGWLMRDETALNYALSRGWTQETVEKHMLGYTGNADQRKDYCKHLRGEFVVSGVDPESPAAVSLIGFNGKVDGWLRANKLEGQSVWVEQGFVPSFVGKDMLVYPHFLFGRVRYYSGRGVQEKRHYNLPRELVGERQIYVNGVWKPNERNCVIVEGQADAISLAQLGIPAVASAGTSIDDSFRERMRGHITLYLGMDNDQAGAVGAWKSADILGPMTRMVKWPDGKDANDWLLSMVRNRVPEETQVDRSKKLLAAAPTYAEVITHWAGQQMGAERDDAQKKALAVIAKMDSVTLAQYRSKLAKAMDLNVRDFNHVLKTMSDLPNPDKAKEPTEFVETLGGWFDDTLVELLYDKESNYTKFAIRKPDGMIEEVDYYDYDNKRFVPPFPEDAMTKDVVMLPSKVVPLRSVRELIAIIRNFIHRYLDVDSFYERLASYYVLFTWMYDAFTVLPYLRALGDYGTGKSRMIQAIGILCYRPIFTAGATTTSPIFRMLERFRGTLVLDEADFSKSDESSDIIKILNSGYMKGSPVLRTEGSGQSGFTVKIYDVYGPKVIATRKKFMDRATESRCLTKEMGGGIPRLDIPIVLPKAFNEQAREIRNLLLAYRMKYLQPEIEVDYNTVDRSIEPRLNQVTMALKTIVDEPDLKEEIDGFIRNYNRQLIVERSMSLDAKVLEAVVRIRRGNPIGVDENGPFWDFSLKHITKMTNEVIDEENRDEDGEEEEEDGDRKYSRKKLGPKRIGAIVRNNLQLSTERATSGPFRGNYYAVYEEERIMALCSRFGIDPPDHNAPILPVVAPVKKEGKQDAML